MSLAVITDSTSYLPPGVATELGVRVVPLRVTLGEDEVFVDGMSDPDQFYARLRASGARPESIPPTVGQFLDTFQSAADDGATEILCITCASDISETYRSALDAASKFDRPVEVVDSRTIGGGLFFIVSGVARALQHGATPTTAIGVARSMAGRVYTTFATFSTQLLIDGGRLPADAAPSRGLNVLVMEGPIRSLGQPTSVEEAVAWQALLVRESAAQSPTRVAIGHAMAATEAELLVDALVDAPGVIGIDRYVIGPAVGAQVGPGTFSASTLAPGRD